MAHPLTAATEAIAAVLGGLSGLTRVHPYPRPLSSCKPGEGVMAITETSPPDTAGGNFQTVIWNVVVFLRSSASGPIKKLHEDIADLCSLDPDKGILGVLYNNDTQLAALQAAGVDPFIEQGDEGVTVDYSQTVGDKPAILLTCQLRAEIGYEE